MYRTKILNLLKTDTIILSSNNIKEKPTFFVHTKMSMEDSGLDLPASQTKVMAQYFFVRELK